MTPIQKHPLSSHPPVLTREPIKIPYPFPSMPPLFPFVAPLPFTGVPLTPVNPQELIDLTNLARFHHLWNKTLIERQLRLHPPSISNPSSIPLNTKIANTASVVDSKEKAKVLDPVTNNKEETKEPLPPLLSKEKEPNTPPDSPSLQSCAKTSEEINPALVNIPLTSNRYKRLQLIKNLGLQYICLSDKIGTSSTQHFSYLLSSPNLDKKCPKRDFDKRVSEWRKQIHRTYESLEEKPSIETLAQKNLPEFQELQKLKASLLPFINVYLDDSDSLELDTILSEGSQSLQSPTMTTISLEENRLIGRIRQIVIGMFTFEFQQILHVILDSEEMQNTLLIRTLHLQFDEEKIIHNLQEDPLSPSKVSLSDFNLK